ncbi:hypothetical protein PDIDSM_5932 [Penicillium digitatum]|nr:hypothetical protein PDIDSM_5932 [Penicillium digitatum]
MPQWRHAETDKLYVMIRSIFRELRNEARLRWWTRSLKNSPSGTDAGQTPTRLIHCRNSNSDDQRSTAGLPSARRMATSTGTTASSTTKTPNSTAHAAAESHQSTSLSATKPRGLSDTGQNAPRHSNRQDRGSRLPSQPGPKQFVELLELTSFYSRVCTR